MSNNRTKTVSPTVPGVTATRDAAGSGPATIGPHAGQVVRRVLLRRNIVINAETAQLVAAAVQTALQVSVPSRPPRRGPGCSLRRLEPLF